MKINTELLICNILALIVVAIILPLFFSIFYFIEMYEAVKQYIKKQGLINP